MNKDEKEIVCNKPFYKDPDPGPASAWEWAYRDTEPGELVARSDMVSLRSWAFPLWDFSRIQSAGILGDPGIAPCFEDPEFDEYERQERRARLKESQSDRDGIRLKGGTGFYCPGNLSKVKWEP
jgi:hypothetical protein